MKQSPQLAVLGIGHAGCKIATRLAVEWTDHPTVLAVGTDPVSLGQCPEGVLEKVWIGEFLTGGSTGGDPEIGRQAAERERPRLQNIFAGLDLAFLVGGLGGGLATGALPVLARLARAGGCLTVGLVTLPFEFEGEYRRRRAEAGLQALREAADVVIALPNQHLFQLFGREVRVAEAFERADGMVSHALYCLWRMMARPGILGLDFADIRALIKGAGGIGAFGFGQAEGESRAEEAARRLVQCPYLEGGRLLHEAEAVLISVTGGPDMTLAEVDTVGRRIREVVRSETPLLMGTSVDPEWEGRIGITLLVAEQWSAEPSGQLRLGLQDLPSGEEPTRAEPEPVFRTEEGQGELSLANRARGRDRFKDSEPTLENGENLDIPTFLRRKVLL